MIIFYSDDIAATQGSVDLHSTRLFCSGVPVSTTLLRVLIAFIALEILDASLRRMCPSSHTTKSGPEKQTAQIETISAGKAVAHSDDIIPLQSYCTWIHQYPLYLFLQLFTADPLDLWQDAVHVIAHQHHATISLPPLQSSDSVWQKLYCGHFCNL